MYFALHGHVPKRRNVHWKQKCAHKPKMVAIHAKSLAKTTKNQWNRLSNPTLAIANPFGFWQLPLRESTESSWILVILTSRESNLDSHKFNTWIQFLFWYDYYDMKLSEWKIIITADWLVETRPQEMPNFDILCFEIKGKVPNPRGGTIPYGNTLWIRGGREHHEVHEINEEIKSDLPWSR